MKSRTIKRLATVILLAMAPTTLVACAKGGSTASSEDTAGGTLTLWTHSAGNNNELASIKTIVARSCSETAPDALRDRVRVRLQEISIQMHHEG